MNVFILSTGRCGSTTFVEACKHIKNYTATHESRHGLIGLERLNYPDNHIESDNRLSWFLGRLDDKYGDDAFYVHLTRDRVATAKSYARRFDRRLISISDYSIVNPYARNIIGFGYGENAALDICIDYCETVDTNINLFLKDKTKKMNFNLENAKTDFQKFWQRIGAEGDLDRALAEWDVSHNKSESPQKYSRLKRKLRLISEIIFN